MEEIARRSREAPAMKWSCARADGRGSDVVLMGFLPMAPPAISQNPGKLVFYVKDPESVRAGGYTRRRGPVRCRLPFSSGLESHGPAFGRAWTTTLIDLLGSDECSGVPTSAHSVLAVSDCQAASGFLC